PAAEAVTSTSPDAVAYQADIAHDGHVVDSAITLPLDQRWSIPVENPSYPIIAQGLVIVTSRGSTIGGYGTRLSAFDQATGDEVWARNIKGTYYWSNAAYEAGKVFVVDYDGLLRALDAATGTKLWSVQLPDESAFSSPPTADGGIVYAVGAGYDGIIYAVDESTGNILWTQGVLGGSNSSPALSSGSLFVGYACHQSYAFARGDGSLLWHHAGSCIGGGGRTAAYYRSAVYLRDNFSSVDNGLVLGVNLGHKRGTFTSSTIPAFTHDTGFFLDSGTLRAKNLPDMSTAWAFAGNGDLNTAPLVVNGVVFEGSTSGRIYALRAKTGHGVWHADVGAEIPHPDEQNVSQPLTGLGAGDGLLVVPAVDRLVAYGSA
ncbi:MAG: PQQ-binding-like beta-propeller repeat protein, partial [Actinomycetota bacterium]